MIEITESKAEIKSSMRFREQLPENMASVDSGMMLGTVIYALLLGIFFVVFGIKMRKRWVTFWGTTMVLASGAHLIATVALPDF